MYTSSLPKPRDSLVHITQTNNANSIGTSETPVQQDLRWDADVEVADNICNFNRRYAEHRYYWKETPLYDEITNSDKEVTFYDSNTGKPLFIAPRGRSMKEFVTESLQHGWPSFRDEEVVWENVRCLPNGETVSIDGTHLGDNLPDSSGSRYCIDLVCIAGHPTEDGVIIDTMYSNFTEDTNDTSNKGSTFRHSTGISGGVISGIVIGSLVGVVVIFTRGKNYIDRKINCDKQEFFPVEGDMS